jgi:hypothetical protein
VANLILLEYNIGTAINILSGIEYATIGIHLQEVDIPFLVHPQIDPSITDAIHAHEHPPGDLLQFLLQLLILHGHPLYIAIIDPFQIEVLETLALRKYALNRLEHDRV